MKPIDTYSYHLGAADCFCEIVKAGVKRIALSHPCDTKAERDSYLEAFEELCKKYAISYYVEDSLLLSDLFPHSANKDKYTVIFYKEEADLQEYLSLKEITKTSLNDGTYDTKRWNIAYRFGKLLSYSDEAIKTMINIDNENR